MERSAGNWRPNSFHHSGIEVPAYGEPSPTRLVLILKHGWLPSTFPHGIYIHEGVKGDESLIEAAIKAGWKQERFHGKDFFLCPECAGL
jgi:hypothetical protein